MGDIIAPTAAARPCPNHRILLFDLEDSEEGDDFSGILRLIEESSGLDAIGLNYGQDLRAPLLSQFVQNVARRNKKKQPLRENVRTGARRYSRERPHRASANPID